MVSLLRAGLLTILDWTTHYYIKTLFFSPLRAKNVKNVINCPKIVEKVVYLMEFGAKNQLTQFISSA